MFLNSKDLVLKNLQIFLTVKKKVKIFHDGLDQCFSTAVS